MSQCARKRSSRKTFRNKTEENDCFYSCWSSVLCQEPVLVSIASCTRKPVHFPRRRMIVFEREPRRTDNAKNPLYFFPLLARRFRTSAKTIVAECGEALPPTLEDALELVNRYGRLGSLETGAFRDKLTDVSAFRCVDNLTVLGVDGNVKSISGLDSARTLRLLYCYGMDELDFPKGVRMMEVIECSRVSSFKNLATPAINRELDVSAPLRSLLHTLVLNECRRVTDVAALGFLHTLHLTRCLGVKDVSALGRVHTLNLEGCSGVTDVSALCGVHTLNLNRCPGVKNVSALGQLHQLEISDCSSVTNVGALGRVCVLDISSCVGVADVSALGGVHTLEMSFCHEVSDVSALGGVHTLDLCYCSNVEDVSALGGVDTLCLIGCVKVKDISALRSVPTLVEFTRAKGTKKRRRTRKV